MYVINYNAYGPVYHHETCKMLATQGKRRTSEAIPEGEHVCRRCMGLPPEERPLRARRSAAKPVGRFTVEDGHLVPLACPVCLSQQYLDRHPTRQMWTCRCGWEGKISRTKWQWNGQGHLKKR